MLPYFKSYKCGRLARMFYVEVPASEKWLFDNPAARESVSRGLADAKNGRVSDLGSFAKYADEAGDS